MIDEMIVPDKTQPDKPCDERTISSAETAHFRSAVTERSEESKAELSQNLEPPAFCQRT